ncbi:conserved hypothetical protein [Streptomyces viridosporus ATCC 14672]|uniref:Pyrrolo-quinoline quinone repeat domain-containing protein n=2 Tax=Streptomyces viridosporus TaxID=67581 RepID=D5ZVF9_STRV1|nr:conserved hypothetical protein [Streptomyces viridosporus ATCC 14672]
MPYQPHLPPHPFSPQAPPASAYPSSVPPQPPYPPAPSGPGGSGGGRRRLAVLVGSALAALLVIGAGTVFALRDSGEPQADGKPGDAATSPSSSPTPTSIEARELFRVEAPDLSGYEFLETPRMGGSWVTSRIYASGAENAVTGHHVATGKPAWTVDLPGTLCRASRDVNRAGLVAVIFKPSNVYKESDRANTYCTRLAVIDVNKGAKLWEEQLDESVARGWGLSVAISDTVAAVGWPGGSLAYQASTGASVWDAPTKGCTYEEHLGGRQLLTLGYCQTPAGKRFRVGQRDERTGKTDWTYDLPKVHGAWMISSKPLVLGVMRSEDGLDADQLLTISEQGTVQSTIDLGDDYIPGCGPNRSTCNATVVTGHTAYLPSDPHALAASNKITAFDLRTGKPARTFDATKYATWVPVRADGDALIAIERPGAARPARVLRLGPDTGQAEILLRMPRGHFINRALGGMIDKDGGDLVLYEEGRLFLHTAYISSNEATRRKELLTVAYTNR